MAKTPIGEILKAIEAIGELKDIVADHGQAIDRLITRIEELEKSVRTIEGRRGGPAAS